MKTYSMNDSVYFKLTERGLEFLIEQNKELKKMHPQLGWHIRYYKDDWMRGQLWALFRRFGSEMEAGRDCFISEITFNDPNFEEVNNNAAE